MQTDQTVLPKVNNQARLGSLFYLINFLCAGAYNPFLFVYFAELGLSGEQIGWLASLAPLIMLFAFPVASLADRKRWRVRITQGGLIGVCLTLILLRFQTSFVWIVLLMLMMAIFNSPLMAVSDSLIARMAQRHNLNYGGMRLWGSFGFATSALAFGGLWQLMGFKPMFIVAPMFLLPLIWLVGKFEEGSVDLKQVRPPVSVLFRDRGLMLILLATFLSGISNSLAMTFGGIYARYIGGGNLLIGMMIAFAGYAEILTMFYSNRISGRLQAPNTAILAYGLMAVAYIGYILLPFPITLPFFSILKGLGYGLWFTTTVRLITERTPAAWASTAQSMLAISMFGMAPLVAGPLGGWIHDAFNPAAVFGLGVVTLAMAAVVLWLAARQGKLE